MFYCVSCFFFFFFNDTATTEIYTLSLHDALPICPRDPRLVEQGVHPLAGQVQRRSEEHTSELQSPTNLVCRLLLEKKKKNKDKSRENVESDEQAKIVNTKTDD